MKSATAAVSILVLSSVSAIAADTAPPSDPSSLLMITSITSGTKPAVDGLNGELWVYGGAGMGNAISTTPITGLSIAREQSGSNFQGISGVTGVITAPIGHDFGLQIDLGTGTFERGVQGNAAGHFFWRNPDQGLVGIYGSGQYWARKGGKTGWNIGPELEKYFDQFTVGGTLGVQGFDFYNVTWDPTIPIKDQRTPCNHQPIRFFDNVSVKYYPTDDVMVKVGHSYVKGDNAITAGAEYIPEQFRGNATATALFVDGAYGWDKGSMIMGGAKIYFGNSDKSLKRRHREDDPNASPFDPSIVPSPSIDRCTEGDSACLINNQVKLTNYVQQTTTICTMNKAIQDRNNATRSVIR